MFGKLEEIEGIEINERQHPPSSDQHKGAAGMDIRDHILNRIREIAGKDSIKRIVPIQNQGDHKTQDIVFEMDQKEYLATLRYNNALTEGWVEDVKKEAKKC